MKGFATTFLAILVFCAFATGCESTSGNDGVSRFAWSTLRGPGSDLALPPMPDRPMREQGSI
ncbi:MAG: hypothetical protein ABMA14_04020 [Hyphomonadaceae bacterium]